VKSLILIGDARKRLAELPAGSARTCITSPPYFGLRDYGTASWEGGDENCQHTISAKDADNKAVFSERVTRGDRSGCVNCGAMRVDSQIGLEPTPDAYVAEMVELFREVWRVLADNGTLWLNLGDSYVGGKGQSGQGSPDFQAERAKNGESINQAYHQIAGSKQTRPTDDRAKMREAGLKPKDLIGIPWRLAFALQADGWYLRSDIIWAKPNPMPESVRDRPTKSHEYVFLLSKSPRYYYDHEAIKEDGVIAAGTKGAKGSAERQGIKGVNARPPEYKVYDGKRNKRDVWTISTKPFKGAHFAVMPEALVEPCVLAGSAEGDTVLDPFTGSGTVAVVANRHGRDFIGTELNPEYGEIAYNRITNDAPLMNEVEIRD
jgi:DNA modification methylase